MAEDPGIFIKHNQIVQPYFVDGVHTCPECGKPVPPKMDPRIGQPMMSDKVYCCRRCNDLVTTRRQYHNAKKEVKQRKLVRHRAARKAKIARGICSRCMKNPATPGMRTCQQCRDEVALVRTKGRLM